MKEYTAQITIELQECSSPEVAAAHAIDNIMESLDRKEMIRVLITDDVTGEKNVIDLDTNVPF